MVSTSLHAQNEAAYRSLKSQIDRDYPAGHFVAIHDGRIAAHGTTLDEALKSLAASGFNPKECLAVQAGVDYPEYVTIFLGGVRL